MWLESTRWVHPLEESPARVGKTSGNTRHCAGSTKSSRTRAGSSRASPGATPAATYARSRTGKRASHHFCGVSRSGWASSGACQGKAVRRCRRRSSLLTSSPGAACFRQWSMEPLHRPRRWWASVPSKSQIRHFTMPPSQGVEVREQDLLQMHGSGRAARRVPPELHGLEPLGVVEREEPELRQDVCGAEQPRVAYRRQLTRLPGDLHVVGGERLAAVLEGEAARLQPHCGLATGQRLLAVQAPVPEPGVPERIQGAREPAGEEGAPEFLLAVPDAREEAEHFRRGPAPVFPLAVGPVGLRVVVLDKPVVRRGQFGPALGLGEAVVGHASLDVEGGLDVALPRPAPLYLFFVDPEGFVGGPGLPRPEDAPAVGDQGLGRAVPLDGRVEDGEVGGEVLGARDGARQDGSGVVVQDGDDVEPARELEALEVADVRAPELVPSACGEGHLPLLLYRSLGLLQPVEGAVGGEDAPAGPRAEVYAYLGERGVDAVLPEVRVLLEPPHRLHRPERHPPHARRTAVRSILQALRSRLGPPPQDPVYCRLVDPHVARDGLRAPAFGVERDDREAPLAAFRDLVVRGEAPTHAQRHRLLGQDAADGLVVGTPAEEDVADVGYLVEVEARVLRLEVDDAATQRRRELAVPGAVGAEQALHALRLEAPRPALEGPLGSRTRLTCALGGGAAEEHERTDELVVPLLRPQAQQL